MGLSKNSSENHKKIEKLTRWDRITKKHLNSVNVQTVQVRRIFDMQFVSGDQLQHMSGRGEGQVTSGMRSGRRNILDPALVMDMRHEVIRRKTSHSSQPKSKPIDQIKAVQLERIRSHNERLEQRYVDQEIEKYRKSICSPKKTEFIVRLNNYHQSDPKQTNTLEDHGPNYSPKPDIVKRINDKEDISYETETPDADQPKAVELTSEPITEYVFDHLAAIESFEKLDNNNVQYTMNSTKTLGIDINNFQEIPSKISDPFDEPIDPRKVVRFEYLVENIKSDEEESNSEESFRASLDFSDPASGENFELNNRSHLQLIGKHIDVPIDESHRYQKEKSPEHTVSSPDTDRNLPVLSVTKINTNQIKNSTASMSIALIPKLSEVAFSKNEIISELLKPKIGNSQSPVDTHGDLLRRYFYRWLNYATVEKAAGFSENQNQSRQLKINQFLQTVRQEKQRQSIYDTDLDKKHSKEISVSSNDALKNKLNSKLKMQREIIDLQNIKLKRQEQMIAELKLNRLTEDTRKSKAAAKEELRNVIRHGNAKLRTTARCVQLIGNLRENEDDSSSHEFARLQAKGEPKFLIDMQTRALERNIRHQEARDRRERLEREKEEQRLAAEALKLKQDEEAKRQRIEELRQKRQLERLQRQRKEEERIRYLDNMHKAAVFNRRRLLKRFGMDKFHALIKIKRRNERKMQMFRVFIVLRSNFNAWHTYVMDLWAERKKQADKHRRLQLLRLGMDRWKQYQSHQASKMLVAIDWYDMRLAEQSFRRWDNYTRHQRCIEEVKMRQAEAHYNWHLKWRVIEHWQRLHAILQLERETDERRQKWRLKIWELLPDYQPATTMYDNEKQPSKIISPTSSDQSELVVDSNEQDL